MENECPRLAAFFKTIWLKNVHVFKCGVRSKIRYTYFNIIHLIRLIIYFSISESRSIEKRIYIEQKLKYPHVYEHESSLILHRSGIIKRVITIGIMHKNYYSTLHITEFCGRRGWRKVVNLSHEPSLTASIIVNLQCRN